MKNKLALVIILVFVGTILLLFNFNDDNKNNDAGKLFESEINNSWLVLEKDTFQLNETIRAKFRPSTTKNIYIKAGTFATPWEIYVK